MDDAAWSSRFTAAPRRRRLDWPGLECDVSDPQRDMFCEACGAESFVYAEVPIDEETVRIPLCASCYSTTDAPTLEAMVRSRSPSPK